MNLVDTLLKLAAQLEDVESAADIHIKELALFSAHGFEKAKDKLKSLDATLSRARNNLSAAIKHGDLDRMYELLEKLDDSLAKEFDFKEFLSDVNVHHGTFAELIKARDEATSRNTKRRG